VKENMSLSKNSSLPEGEGSSSLVKEAEPTLFLENQDLESEPLHQGTHENLRLQPLSG